LVLINRGGEDVVVSGAAPSILLVDDHAVIVAPLVLALQSAGFARVAAVDPDDLSPEAILRAARLEQPDIVLLDLHLGADRLALGVIEPLVELGAAVVLFTASQDGALLGAGLRAGAVGIVDKSTPFHQLVTSLTAVAGGEDLMSFEERQALIEAVDRRHAWDTERRGPFERLSEREAYVLRLLISGRSPKRIAHEEGLSVATVRGHIQGVLSKLGVSSQREALALARALGWPEGDRG
jgi:DNA-binding NarL/FixJ family response regulator